MPNIEIATPSNNGAPGLAFFLFAMAFVASIAGCTSNGSRTHSPTGGADLIMYIRDATGAESRYEVDRDGALRFGGGLAARIDKTTWAGQLTPDEQAEFRRVLQEQNWFKEKPASTGEPRDQVYRITINSPENRRRFTFKGESPGLKTLRDLLDRASRRRLEGDLKALPEPGPQRK